jgi:hypothetical protein
VTVSGKRRYTPRTFVIVCCSIATATGGALAMVGSGWGPEVVRWSLIGWFGMTAVGIVGGAWLLAQHGTRGVAFLVPLGASMLARLILAPAGAFAASAAGVEAVSAYLVGLAVGYVPPQASEVVWLMAKGK